MSTPREDVLTHACNRLFTKLNLEKTDWYKELHVHDHFKRMPGKESHGVFIKRYHDWENLRALIQRAASKPSTKCYAPLTTGGAPAVEVARDFNFQIGTNGETVLLIIVELEGDLVTAYPITTTRMAQPFQKKPTQQKK